MSGWSVLDCFLRTDPEDVGCAEAMEMLPVYAGLVAAGEPGDERYCGVAARLRVGGGFRRAAGRAWRGGRLTGPVPFSAPERLTAVISRSLGKTCLPPGAHKRRADNGGTGAAGRVRLGRRKGSR